MTAVPLYMAIVPNQDAGPVLKYAAPVPAYMAPLPDKN
jgi:hypothetical protein